MNPRLTYREGSAKHLFTKTLEIRNNRYDSYTHYYLGEYLRFLRDYNQLDLMSLYNCFGNERVDNLRVPDRTSD